MKDAERDAVEADFWSWSCAVYGAPGVKEALLTLQDRYGLSVTMVLWCAWAARKGYAPQVDDVAAVFASLEDLDALGLEPLRRARRYLTLPRTAAFAAHQPGLKKLLLDAELATEKALQAQVVSATLSQMGPPHEDTPSATRDWQLIAQSALATYTQLLEKPVRLADDRASQAVAACFVVLCNAEVEGAMG